jgi:hypothetical protein
VVGTILEAVGTRAALLSAAGMLLTPIQGLIGTNSEGFLSLGISSDLVGLCAKLLSMEECDDSILDIGELVANIALVDAAVAPECRDLAQGMLGAQREDVVFVGLEIGLALVIKNGRVSDPRLLEMAERAIREDWVVSLRHARLFRVGLAVALKMNEELEQIVTPLLVALKGREALFAIENEYKGSEELNDLEVPQRLMSLEIRPRYPSIFLHPSLMDFARSQPDPSMAP